MFSKKKLLFLVVAVFIVSLNLSPAFASQQKYRASFFAYASGECLALPEYSLGPGQPKEAFIGRGAILLAGHADVNQYLPSPPLFVTYYLADSGVKAHGVVSARWSGNMISALLYSSSATNGAFIDEGNMLDLFTVGIRPGEVGIPSMSFKGIYKDIMGTHTVSGKAAFLAFPVGPSSTPTIGVMLFKPDNTPFLTILWMLQDMPLPGVILHAAESFVHRVEIIELS